MKNKFLHFSRNDKNKGFSLVELLVVITIIAILSVTAYIAVGGHTVKARDSKRLEDLSTLQSALEIYFVKYERYPASPLISGADTDAGEIPKSMLSEIPVDPKGDSYAYVRPTMVTYQLAATLEDDGDPTNFLAKVVGNSDNNDIGAGVQWDVGSSSFTACPSVVDAGTCLPYDPTD